MPDISHVFTNMLGVLGGAELHLRAAHCGLTMLSTFVIFAE